MPVAGTLEVLHPAHAVTRGKMVVNMQHAASQSGNVKSIDTGSTYLVKTRQSNVAERTMSC